MGCKGKSPSPAKGRQAVSSSSKGGKVCGQEGWWQAWGGGRPAGAGKAVVGVGRIKGVVVVECHWQVVVGSGRKREKGKPERRKEPQCLSVQSLRRAHTQGHVAVSHATLVFSLTDCQVLPPSSFLSPPNRPVPHRSSCPTATPVRAV